MQIGIMTRTLSRLTLDQVADAVCGYGIQAVQLNLSSAGLPALPAELDLDAARRIGDVFRARGLRVAAVSANFNSTHPNPGERSEGIRRVGLLASRCSALGAGILTLCTGSRDPENMWRHHPANRHPSAWDDLIATTRLLLRFVEAYDLMLAFEPEAANVIDDAAKAEMFLAEAASPRLRILLDPANLVRPADLPDTRPVLRDAFSRLGPHIAMAHAKDVAPPLPGGLECRRVTAGRGCLDYPYYIRQLVAAGFDGTLVLHDLAEPEIEPCRSMLRELLAASVS